MLQIKGFGNLIEANSITQEDVNKKMQDICKSLKNINIISLDYIEYLGALIYAMYENEHNLKNLPKIELGDVKYLAELYDKMLNKIRQKENSKKLFINIRFSEIINSDNELSFKKIIIELSELILKLENAKKNTKSMLAEAFEYIIMKSAQNDEIALKNGEFYTPKGIVKSMIKILDVKDNNAIYNPACGTGNFITASAKNREIFAFGEEENLSNYNICMTNLWLHDIKNKRIKQDSREEFQLADIAIANPPFVSDYIDNSETSPRLQELYYRYGLSPSSSNYTKFLAKMLESVHNEGKISVILPHGFLFKKAKGEYNIRRKLIEDNYIDAIIGLPEKLFYNTKIPVIILIINKARKRDKILFIDASREFVRKRKTNILSVENQNKIADTYHEYQIVPNYSYLATFKEIRDNDFDLNIKKYVKIQNEIKVINQKEIEEYINNLEKERYETHYKIQDLIEKIKRGRIWKLRKIKNTQLK